MRNPHSRTPARRNFFTDGEEGMISLVSLFAVLGLLILFGLFANAGRTTARKLETQNAADASAHAAALEMARTLNSITAANHLMGELTALCVLHHGFGGDELDEGNAANTKKSKTFTGMLGREGKDLDLLLQLTYELGKLFCKISNTGGVKPAPDTTSVYDEVRVDPITGGAIGDSHTRLKQVLVWAFGVHAIAAIIWVAGDICLDSVLLSPAAPFLYGLAIFLAANALVFEFKCLQEMKTLKVMKQAFGFLKFTVKTPLLGTGGFGAISAIGNPTPSYSTLLHAATPDNMRRAAEDVAKENLTSVVLYPPHDFKQVAAAAEALSAAAGQDFDSPVAPMPLHRDQSKPPAENSDPEIVKTNTIPNPRPLLQPEDRANGYAFDREGYTAALRNESDKPLTEWRRSQLVRATTPWVQYWRVPFLEFGQNVLLLSRFKAHYWDRTDEYTLKLTARLQLGKSTAAESGSKLLGVRPFVLKGWGPGLPKKGDEEWTKADGSRRADELFGTVAIVTRPALPLTSAPIFRRTNPDGLTAYAQAMVYNANSQNPGGPPDFQPEVGWDTLNWGNRVKEFPGDRPTRDDYPVRNVDRPIVKLNWQAKLVPVSRLSEPQFWGLLEAESAGLSPLPAEQQYGPNLVRLRRLFETDQSLTKLH